nr:reverse transcriptase domain, reverse transcriptase zinc-binding domain protein [Tanacetum cinerariifolium]
MVGWWGYRWWHLGSSLEGLSEGSNKVGVLFILGCGCSEFGNVFRHGGYRFFSRGWIAFGWHVFSLPLIPMKDRLPTDSKLDARRMDLDSLRCPVCNDGIELTSHLFFWCTVAAEIWRMIKDWWGLVCTPNDLDGILSWHESAQLNTKENLCFDVVINTSTWVICNIFSSTHSNERFVFMFRLKKEKFRMVTLMARVEDGPKRVSRARVNASQVVRMLLLYRHGGYRFFSRGWIAFGWHVFSLPLIPMKERGSSRHRSSLKDQDRNDRDRHRSSLETRDKDNDKDTEERNGNINVKVRKNEMIKIKKKISINLIAVVAERIGNEQDMKKSRNREAKYIYKDNSRERERLKTKIGRGVVIEMLKERVNEKNHDREAKDRDKEKSRDGEAKKGKSENLNSKVERGSSRHRSSLKDQDRNDRDRHRSSLETRDKDNDKDTEERNGNINVKVRKNGRIKIKKKISINLIAVVAERIENEQDMKKSHNREAKDIYKDNSRERE